MFIISAVLFLLTILIAFAFRKKSRKLYHPPGPSGIPIFGIALEINERNMFEKLYQYAENYGDIVRIKFFNKSIICLNSIDIARKVLCSDPYKEHMNDRVKYCYSDFLYYGGQSIALYKEANSVVHRGMRKGYIKALHVYDQDGITAFERMILSELDNLNKRIEEFGGKEFDVLALTRRSLTSVISVLLGGELVSDDDEDINMFWDYSDEIIFLLNPVVNTLLVSCPLLRFAPGFRSHMTRIYNAKDKLLNRFLTNRKRLTGDGPKCLVDALLEQQASSEAEGKEVIFTDERIESTIIETVFAGITTTWSVLTSTLFCLINYPEYQDQIFAELDKIISQDRRPSCKDKSNCPILEAVEMEVHRLFTVSPTLISRLCTKDLNLEGYDIRKGTEIIVNIWRIHHDSNIWEDPWEFRPERFLNEDGQLIARDSILRKNWIPFSLGRRQCVGEQFARSRYFLYMASLLRKWKFVGVPGKYSPLDAKLLRNFDTKVVIRPKPFFCTAEKRF